MMYIRKRPKEKGLLETKHEFKIFEVCVSCANTITMCSIRITAVFKIWRSDFGADIYRMYEMQGTETDLNRQLFRVVSVGQFWLDKARKSGNTVKTRSSWYEAMDALDIMIGNSREVILSTCPNNPFWPNKKKIDENSFLQIFSLILNCECSKKTVKVFRFQC